MKFRKSAVKSLRKIQFNQIVTSCPVYLAPLIITYGLEMLLISRNFSCFFKYQTARKFSQSLAAMVKVGDKIPNVELFEDSPANKINMNELSGSKKLIIFGVPGAFTPGCSKTHLPGYIDKADDIKKEQGIDDIICISVNDPFVMSAWGKQHNAIGKVRMLADPSASFVKALDLTIDLPPLGGQRSKRFSMVVENGEVKELNVEPDGTGLSCSLAQNIGKK